MRYEVYQVLHIAPDTSRLNNVDVVLTSDILIVDTSPELGHSHHLNEKTKGFIL